MQAGPKFRRFEGGLTYWCQGCRCAHSILVAGEAPADMPGDRWSWNGDLLRPVFGPSVHVWTTEPVNIGDPVAMAAELEAIKKRKEAGETGALVAMRRRTLCHTFIGCNGAQPGEVIFLGDCAHALAGTVQPFPDLPEHLTDSWREAWQPPAPRLTAFTWRKQ